MKKAQKTGPVDEMPPFVEFDDMDAFLLKIETGVQKVRESLATAKKKGLSHAVLKFKSAKNWYGQPLIEWCRDIVPDIESAVDAYLEDRTDPGLVRSQQYRKRQVGKK